MFYWQIVLADFIAITEHINDDFDNENFDVFLFICSLQTFISRDACQ